MAEDPFAVLGVGEDATDKKVESAFRRAALRCHPDRHPKDPLAKARFLRLSRAKEALLDPAKRRAAETQRRSRFQAQRQNTSGASSSSAAGPTLRPRTAASAAAEKKRRAAAEQLKKREAEAQDRRHRAREASERARQAAEAKRRCDQLAAQKEEAARELAAKREERKVELLDTFLRKKQANRAATVSEAARPLETARPIFGAMLKRFMNSSDQRKAFTAPGLLSAADRAELGAAVASYGLLMTEDQGNFEVRKPQAISSESDSPWEPTEGTQADKKVKRLRKRMSKSSSGPGARVDVEKTKHQKALERLQSRRRNGEGLTTTPTGSWWVADEAAERFAKDLDYYGF